VKVQVLAPAPLYFERNSYFHADGPHKQRRSGDFKKSPVFYGVCCINNTYMTDDPHKVNQNRGRGATDTPKPACRRQGLSVLSIGCTGLPARASFACPTDPSGPVAPGRCSAPAPLYIERKSGFHADGPHKQRRRGDFKKSLVFYDVYCINNTYMTDGPPKSNQSRGRQCSVAERSLS